ncbi:MAG: class I SAM-dependent methyltransferase [Loktanella sp.]|nr:class I SAM-dependent methyltransferase [Loktanella sp.]
MGFTASWLALREPADLAARDDGLLAAAVRAAGPLPVIVDLGSGTGSTLRAFAPVLGGTAAWRLVDSDPALLAQAALSAGPEVALHRLDLRTLAALPLQGASLVTASALLDLCSRDWLTRLAARLTEQPVAFYAALNYDGVMTWTSPDDDDETITAAFNRHQRGDKGFGPALGPDCASSAADVFAKAGFTVTQADSVWVLGPDQAELQQQLCAGIANAAAEMGIAGAQQWAARRHALVGDGHCHIGHRDFLALPPGYQ